MCDFDGDGCEAWSETWRRARKPHDCEACGETIARGDTYHYGSGVFDHSGFTVKHCARCWAMWKAIVKANPGVSVRFDLNCGEVWRDPPEEIAALAFALPGEVPCAG